jgi:hypothetical protein
MLPIELRTWIDNQSELPLTTEDEFMLYWGGTFLIVYLVSLIGLWLLKPWSKHLYIISTIGIFCLYPFLGPTVEHSASTLIEAISSTCSGCIVALILFTPVISNKT